MDEIVFEPVACRQACMLLNISTLSKKKHCLDWYGFVSLCSQCYVFGRSGDEESPGKRQHNNKEKS